MSSNGEEIKGTDSSQSTDPFSPANRQSASSTLESLRKVSLTIYNLSTPVSPLSGYQFHNSNDDSDGKEQRYELALAIVKHAATVRGDFESKRPMYHLALMEYYKLLRLDFMFVGVLESILFLLAILGFDDHCLGLMDFVVDHPRSGTNVPPIAPKTETDEWIEWVYGSFRKDKTLDERLKVLECHQWCPNSFLVPLFLIQMRTTGTGDSDCIAKSARIASRVEEYCSDSTLPVLRGLLVTSKREWGPDEARSLLAHRQDSQSLTNGEPDYWETNCHLFWKIVREYVQDTETLYRTLQETIAYMETVLHNPPVPEEQPTQVSSFMDLYSINNPQAGQLHCIQCRQHVCSSGDKTTSQSPRAMRCSRCCVVHYCSRNCQKKNYPLHKERCKNISNLRSLLSQQAGTTCQTNTLRYDLAYSIVDLAYVSTDTIDRGRRIYHLALVEYCQLLQEDFYFEGALESTLILLSILGYENPLLGLIDFVSYRLEDYPEEKISIDNNGVDDPCLLEWAQGLESPGRKNLWKNLEGNKRFQDGPWGANNFLVPLLVWSIQKQSRQRKESEYTMCLTTSAKIGRAIEQSTTLPVLRGLFPDSVQRWTQNEASELLAHGKAEHWNESCLLFWEILKDAIAFTPKLADALEETIDCMENSLKVPAQSEASHDLSGYAEWSKGTTM